jgi:hypothetical protein
MVIINRTHHSSEGEQVMNSYTLVRVDFTFSMPVQEYIEVCRQVAKPTAQQPGLIWTIWPLDAARKLGGAIYLFATREDAAHYLNGPIIEQLCNSPHIHEIRMQMSTIAEEASAITHTLLTPLPAL